MSSHDVEIATPTDATSSLSFHSKDPTLLLTSSWDSTVKLYTSPFERLQEPTSTFQHPAPVLDVTFADDQREGKAFSACLDGGVRELDLTTSTQLQKVVGVHDQGARCISWSTSHQVLISGSWAKTLSVHDTRSNNKTSMVSLPGKVFAMDVTKEKIVVAMSSRKVFIYDIRQLTSDTPPLPWQERESSLKFMTRSLKCMPNGSGYASSSIEGRVAVEFFDPSEESQAKKYAFKCHRQLVDAVDTVYPVNALAFHPTYGTFATGGGDGAVVIWDPTAKKRLRQLPKQPASISCIEFNSDGTRVAIACSVMEEEGTSTTTTAGSSPRNAVVVRQVGDDCKPRVK